MVLIPKNTAILIKNQEESKRLYYYFKTKKVKNLEIFENCLIYQCVYQPNELTLHVTHSSYSWLVNNNKSIKFILVDEFLKDKPNIQIVKPLEGSVSDLEKEVYKKESLPSGWYKHRENESCYYFDMVNNTYFGLSMFKTEIIEEGYLTEGVLKMCDEGILKFYDKVHHNVALATIYKHHFSKIYPIGTIVADNLTSPGFKVDRMIHSSDLSYERFENTFRLGDRIISKSLNSLEVVRKSLKAGDWIKLKNGGLVIKVFKFEICEDSMHKINEKLKYQWFLSPFSFTILDEKLKKQLDSLTDE